jgi:hypothetical protein
MEINAQVGEAAGEVWHLLNNEGPQTFAQLKKKLKQTEGRLNLALGWLAREDKIQIIEEKKNLRVQLK